MISQMSHIMTLANSIIGVSVLAMPFCFKQCGILLATVVLLVSCVLSRLACHFLVKSAVMSRRRNFELLAFHAFGHMGKFLVELFIIGFLVGTCIAFFVVVGDLGPQIVGKVLDKSPEDIRTSLLITTSVFIVLPLGLLRNIDSLSSICTATIAFYLCLVLKIMAESMQHIFAGDWYEHVYYWRPSGILQCLPIFSMALFCQTQLFEIYETIPNVSLEKMNQVVRGALNICTIVYLCVGFFGYIAFCTQPFSGNILMSFEPSLSSDMIKMGFVFSVAFSFPLVIFPCRASLNSLLFRRVYTHEPSLNYLPEARFRCLTIAIVTVSLITGILIPNIEFVLGLVGSTIGVMICLIFPAVFFISISSKHTNERLLAQTIMFIGICIMILGTYANLYAMEESSNTKTLITTNKPLSQINNLPLSLNKDDLNVITNIPKKLDILPKAKDKTDHQLSDVNIQEKVINTQGKDIRQEPPIPVERVVVTEKSIIETQKSVENLIVTLAPEIKEIVEKIKSLNENSNKDLNTMTKNEKRVEQVTSKSKDGVDILNQKEKTIDMQKSDNLINSDAIKKEESELAADADADSIRAVVRREELWKTLEKHKLEQLQMMQEQKEILKDIRQQKQEIEREKQKIAKNLEDVGKIEKLPIRPKEESNLKKSAYRTDSKINNVEISVKELNPPVIESVDEKILPAELKSNPEPLSLNVAIEANNIEQPVISPNDVSEKKNMKNELLPEKVEKIREASEVKNNENEIKMSNSQELSNGPIVNALTKRTLQKSNILVERTSSLDNKSVDNTQDISNNELPNIPEKSGKTIVKTVSQTIEDQFSLPIALKMRNQTKFGLVAGQLTNTTLEDTQMIGRDILESHDREKREIEKEMQDTITKVIIDDVHSSKEFLKSNMVLDDKKECLKSEQNLVDKVALGQDKSKVISEMKTFTTETSLIKTNVYLADQEIENAISVKPNIDLRGEFIKVKQRELKAVNSN